MQSDAPDPNAQHPSTQESESASRTPKRPGQSSHVLEVGPADASSAGARSRRPLRQPPFPRGSSRDTNEMPRSTTPPEASGSGSGSIKYTRTGRVSKATKGQRVHHCEECGKTYTRAEHLRRHQQNHKPGAFPCNHPGCDRSFYREDLLNRHKTRHADPHNPPSRKPSVGSQSSAPDPRGNDSASTVMPPLPNPATSDSSLSGVSQLPPSSDGATRPQNPSSIRTPKRYPVPPHELSRGRVPVPIFPGEQTSAFFPPPWNSSSSFEHDDESPDGRPDAPAYEPGLAHNPYAPHSSYAGYRHQPHNPSPSPAPGVSPMVYDGSWSLPSRHHLSYQDFYHPLNEHTDPSQFIFPHRPSRVLIPEARDIMEQPELDLFGSAHQVTSNDEFSEPSMTDSRRFLDAYWEWVHEVWPVLRRSTFNFDDASPLLRAATLALGGQATGQRSDLATARILHERCQKVLKKRDRLGTHSFRVCDMQAILLIEVYSIYKSRRPPLQLSTTFEEVYRRLANDPDTLSIHSPGSPNRHTGFSDDLEEDEYSKLGARSKQRLLLACYTLEQQHSTLFGRLTIHGFQSISHNLPFPQSQAQWESQMDTSYEQDTPSFDRVSDALKAVAYMAEPSNRPYDIFRSHLMIAYLCDPNSDRLDWLDNQDNCSISLATERSSQTKLVFHVSMLCKHTPVRDLLAVAGESWVMGEKLSTETEYTAAQFTVRDWAAKPFLSSRDYGLDSPKAPVQLALEHALKILAIHQEAPRTGLLFQEWAVYLAVVVVWARAHLMRTATQPPLQPHPQGIIPNPAEARPSPMELENTLSALIVAGATAMRDWHAMRHVLLWAKGRIERVDLPHTCGLISGALDVLGKLVARGNEDGWF